MLCIGTDWDLYTCVQRVAALINEKLTLVLALSGNLQTSLFSYDSRLIGAIPLISGHYFPPPSWDEFIRYSQKYSLQCQSVWN